MSRASPSGIDPPDAFYRRLHAAVRARRTPTMRPRVRNAVAMIIASVSAVGVTVTASQIVYGTQAMGLHAGVRSTSLLAFVASALFLLLLASTFAALWRSRSGLGANIALLTLAGVATAPLYALLTLTSPVHEITATVGLAISPYGIRCVIIASVVGAVVLGCLAWAMRGAAPVGTRTRSIVLGSAAGAWAGLAVFVFCPSGDALHLLIGHVLPVAAFSLPGAVALPAILRP